MSSASPPGATAPRRRRGQHASTTHRTMVAARDDQRDPHQSLRCPLQGDHHVVPGLGRRHQPPVGVAVDQLRGHRGRCPCRWWRATRRWCSGPAPSRTGPWGRARRPVADVADECTTVSVGAGARLGRLRRVPTAWRGSAAPPGAESSTRLSMSTSTPGGNPGWVCTTWGPGPERDAVGRRSASPHVEGARATAADAVVPVMRHRHRRPVHGEEVDCDTARAAGRGPGTPGACRGCPSRRCRWAAPPGRRSSSRGR